MKIVFVRLFVVICFGSLILTSWSAGADARLQVSELSTLRARLEIQGKEVEMLQKSNLADQEMLKSRKRELEARLRVENMKKEQLRLKRSELLSKIGVSKDVSAMDRKKLIEWGESLRNWVQNQSVPFDQRVRLQKVDELILDARQTRRLDEIMLKLWALTESELKLTRENRFEIQDVSVPEVKEPVKAEVARLGLGRMYYRGARGESGVFVVTDQGVRHEVLDQSAKVALGTLLEKFRVGKTSGYFVLPKDSTHKQGAIL